MLKAGEFCRIVGITKMSFVEFCRGKVGFVEICLSFVDSWRNLSTVDDKIKRMSKGVD